VGADSRQIYRGLEVGTGAPSAAIRARVTHHLVGFLEPSEGFSAGRYGRAAREAVAGIEARGRRAIVAGGSGLYIRAFLAGLFEGPAARPEVRARLRSALETEGVAALRERLRLVDPEAFRAIMPGDSVRLIRALEVYESTGTAISALRRDRPGSRLEARVIGIRWPRPLLVERIRARLAEQLRSGFVEEARRLLGAGLPEAAPGPRTLGYRELILHLRGALTLAQAAELILVRTRQLAKRQETWFRKMEGVDWIEARSPEDLERSVESAAARLAQEAGL
jgi:tRNA dimethylallyltransferase